MTPTEQCQLILHKIAKRYPEIKWFRILSVDGITFCRLGGLYHAIDDPSPDIYENADESPIDSMGILAFSISEGIIERLRMGDYRFTIISATKQTMIVTKIGASDDFILFFALNNYSSLDEIMDYLSESAEIAELERALKDWSYKG